MECLEIAAARLGTPELAIDIQFAHEDKHYELMQTAAELYLYLSDLHKHGVVRGGVIEAQSLPLRPEDLEWVNSCVTQITPTEPLPTEVLALTVCVDLTEHDYEPIGNQMWRCQKCGNEIRAGSSCEEG